VNAYEPGDVRKSHYYFAEQLCMMVEYQQQLKPRYNFKAYSSAYTDAWETDANIKYLRYAEVVLMKAEAKRIRSNSCCNPFIKPN
jgi:hypothetical protein